MTIAERLKLHELGYTKDEITAMESNDAPQNPDQGKTGAPAEPEKEVQKTEPKEEPKPEPKQDPKPDGMEMIKKLFEEQQKSFNTILQSIQKENAAGAESPQQTVDPMEKVMADFMKGM